MNRRTLVIIAGVSTVAAGAGVTYAARSYARPPVLGTAPAAAAPRAATTKKAAAPAIDPVATAALTRMGDYLRTLKDFSVKADLTREEVMKDGQKVQSSATINLVVRRPNKLRAEVANERKPRLYYYDGSTFTLFAPRVHFYAQTEAPGTIIELADKLEKELGITLPLVDAFRWGTPGANMDALSSAIALGPSIVNGVQTQQYIFRQPGADWQLWIEDGDKPLPRKMVITTTSDEARPEQTSEWTWNLSPAIDDAMFTFKPPADAKKIPFAQANAARDSVLRKARTAATTKEER